MTTANVKQQLQPRRWPLFAKPAILPMFYLLRNIFSASIPPAWDQHAHCSHTPHKHHSFTHICTHSHTESVFHTEGWRGNLGFPSPKLKFPPQALLTSAIYLFTIPRASCPLPCHLKNHHSVRNTDIYAESCAGVFEMVCLRVLCSLGQSDTLFFFVCVCVCVCLQYTPRKLEVHVPTGNLVIIETDHRAFTEASKSQRKQQMAEEMVS